MLTSEERAEIQDLAAKGLPQRAISRRLGRNVKTIRAVLGKSAARPATPPVSKLAPFEDLAKQLHAKELRAPRILRELEERGYSGGLTQLKKFLRTLGPPRPSRKVVRRFETPPGMEAQMDWSPYRLMIGGVERVAHCLSMVLACSRRLWIDFYRNERLPTLLHGHVEAFAYHQGMTERILYDNQTAITLGRLHGQPLWNPQFLAFAEYYGFKPRVGKPGHKERRGKIERPFHYVETDFLKGKTFASWDDLGQRARTWLDTIANVRVHGTTHRRVDEAYAEELPLLTRLPDTPFPTDRRENRKVQTDATVLVDGSFYPVPARFVGHWVGVRIYPRRIEIVDGAGLAVATHQVPERPMRLPMDWGPPVPPAEAISRTALELRFLARFPHATGFLDGLRRRMNNLTPIHLRRLERLVGLYGEGAVRSALERATHFRNYSSLTIERILEVAHPNVVPEPPLELTNASPAALAALDDLEEASPAHYPLDDQPPTIGDTDAG